IVGAADGPDFVFRVIAEHGIDCELTRHGLIFAAHADKAAPALERRARFWAERGADVRMLDAAAMEAATGSRYYRAGLLDGRGFCLNPLAYAIGLARAVIAAGGRVHEASPALALREAAGFWRV